MKGPCGLYYKHVTIVSMNLDDDARVVIYDRNMFIILATGLLIFASKTRDGFVMYGKCTSDEGKMFHIIGTRKSRSILSTVMAV